jgi:hypothetical protein
MKPVDSQAAVALAIVAALLAIAIAAMVTAYFAPAVRTEALMIASAAGGSLATALNSPTGVAAALSQAAKAPTP